MTEFNIKTKTAGKCRVYPDSPNGLQPSVTSICGALMKYPLIDWAANCAVDYIKAHDADCFGHYEPDVDYDDNGRPYECGSFVWDENSDCWDNARHAHEQIRDDAADFGTLAH